MPILLIALVVAPATSADDHRFDRERAQFMEAYADPEAADKRDSRQLRAYPLYPYLQSARIERALNEAVDWSPADETAREFLELHGLEPVGRALRSVWLASLARREQWQALVDNYRAGIGDARLRCQVSRAKIALAERNGARLEPSGQPTRDESVDRALEQVESEVIEQWLTPRQLPSECEPIFEWLRERRAMTDDLIERRVRLLLENGQASFAKIIARRLPSERAAALNQWADLIERPARSIDALLANDVDQAVEADALLDGWTRLARADPEAALERYEALVETRGLSDAERSRFALALALGLAWDRRSEALELFAKVDPQHLDDYARAWQTRAALWASDWAAAEASIAAMSDRQRGETRWRYWAGRVAERRGDIDLANALYASVLNNDNFYSGQAAARLGELATPHPEALELDRAIVDQIAERAPFVRARELLLSELRTQAVSEWNFGVADLDDRERTQAVHLAARWEWHDISIAAATRQSVFYDYELLYPRPYDDEVESAALLSALESRLLYGVIRQESLFRPDAVSPAGAIGLMQLTPDTARIIASRTADVRAGIDDLFDPAINIRLGSSYLRALHDRFDGQIVVALAAYNAGPLAAARWLPSEAIDADVWIENIPYNETREYVQRVLWHTVVFAWLQTREAQSTSSWLAPVLPRQLEAAADY